MEPWKLQPSRTTIFYVQATWVPIIYVSFPESKGRELEDFDRLFAGEEDAAINERMTVEGDAEYFARNDSVAVNGGIAHEKAGSEGLL